MAISIGIDNGVVVFIANLFKFSHLSMAEARERTPQKDLKILDERDEDDE